MLPCPPIALALVYQLSLLVCCGSTGSAYRRGVQRPTDRLKLEGSDRCQRLFWVNLQISLQSLERTMP